MSLSETPLATFELDSSIRPGIGAEPTFPARRSAIPQHGGIERRRRSTDDRREGGIPVEKPWVRALNVAVALIGILLALPIMLLVAILVRISSPGPIFYTQPRVGIDRRRGSRRPDGLPNRRQDDHGGRVFTILKFRTMRVASPNAGERWASDGDSRITPIGHFLRKTRLDELPQLFNVLLGDMNIVGPRPEQPGIFRELRQSIDGYQTRQAIRPGITGWAQVNQSYDQNLDDVRRKVELDLDYIRNRSVSRDLRIMARTLPVMLFRKGSL